MFDEYPVENTHSILRAQTNDFDTAVQLRRKAKSIFESKERQAKFRSAFTSPKKFVFSKNQLKYLKLKCAKILSLILAKIVQNTPRNVDFNMANFPSLFPGVPVRSTALPLGYHSHCKPNEEKICDLPQCKVTDDEEEWMILRGCSHSYHVKCLNGITSCPLCKVFLKEKIIELGNIAKDAILNPASEHQNENNENEDIDENNDNIEVEQDTEPNVPDINDDEYERNIADINGSINEIPNPQQPSNIQAPQNANPDRVARPPHCSTCHHPVRGHKRSNTTTSCNFCPNSICTTNTRGLSSCKCAWHRALSNNNINQVSLPQPIQPVRLQIQQVCHRGATEWILPPTLCQSRINGRRGSNACSVISVLSGMSILQGSLMIPKQQQDLSKVIPLYCNAIINGNNIYDSFNMPPNSPNLEVKDVLQKCNKFDTLNLTEDIGCFSHYDLKCKLQQVLQNQQPNQFAVLIIPPDKSLMLCFDNDNICVFDSHHHGTQGGLIAVGHKDKFDEFLDYLSVMALRDWGSLLQGVNLAIISHL